MKASISHFIKKDNLHICSLVGLQISKTAFVGVERRKCVAASPTKPGKAIASKPMLNVNLG